MSRPWNRTIHARIDAQRVNVYSSLATSPAQAVSAPIEGRIQFITECAPIAAAFGAALDAWSKSGAARARTIDVELDDSFVFYDVLEIDVRVMPAAQVSRLAAAALAETIGIAPERLDVRCAVQSGGRSVVVCAVPTALRDAVIGTGRSKGVHVRHFRPAFAAFLDRHRHLMRKGDALAARLSGQFLTFGLQLGGCWKAFASERLQSESWDEFSRACDAFFHRMCVPNAETVPVLFDATLHGSPQVPNGRWHALPSPSILPQGRA